MNQQAMRETAHAIVAYGKGLLAMDESIATCNQRFANANIAQTVEMRRGYRELLLTAPGLSNYISGVILSDESIRQTHSNGLTFVQVAHNAGLLVGIKVDTGTIEFTEHSVEKVTEGLDGLRQRLQSYFRFGARFAKWRSVIAVVDAQLPTLACIEANAHALARYAVLCQEAGLVPVVEPEILMEGDHSQARCQEVTESVLCSVFCQLRQQGVALEAMLLKPNMVISGLACDRQNTATEVADASLQCLLRVVPAVVPGILFLSGGQTGEMASGRLHAMHGRHPVSLPSLAAGTPSGNPILPWTLSFSFARALQYPALEIWAGKETNRNAAQQALLQRAFCSSAAAKGEYSVMLESR